MTPEELSAIGQAIREKIEPVMKERGYHWIGSTTDDKNQYLIVFKKDRFDLKEEPVFVTVEFP